jgi:hypothetical protein
METTLISVLLCPLISFIRFFNRNAKFSVINWIKFYVALFVYSVSLFESYAKN